MLRMRRVVVSVVVVAVMLGLGISLAGEPVYRHSGSVVAVERAAIVLAEGRWKVDNGQTVVTERRITVTKATEVVAVYRDYDNVTGFPGDFKEAPLVDWDLVPGDIVNIECEHRGDRMIALKVSVLTARLP